jgi:exodeoxyribonuclease V alpha subunit
MKNPLPVDKKRVERWIERYCRSKGVSLSDEQVAAAKGIVCERFSILTGGPGCGKTTTTLVLVKLC